MFQHQLIMLSASLLTTLILALSIAASPVEVRNSLVILPIARRLNTSNGTINISQQDHARVDALKDRFASPLDRRDFDMPILNEGMFYTVSVSIGSLDTNCKFNLERDKLRLLMDCLIQTDCLLTLVAQTVYSNTVTFSGDIHITEQSIGVCHNHYNQR